MNNLFNFLNDIILVFNKFNFFIKYLIIIIYVL